MHDDTSSITSVSLSAHSHSQHLEELNKENRATSTMIGREGSLATKQNTTIGLPTSKSTTHGHGTSDSAVSAMNINSWSMNHGHRDTPTSTANSTIATNASVQSANAQGHKKNKNDIWSTTRNHNSNPSAVSNNTVVSSSVSNPHVNVAGTPPYPSINQSGSQGLGRDMEYEIGIDDNDSSLLTPSTSFSSSTLFSSSKGVGHSHSFEDELMIRQMMHSGERNRLEIPRLDQESDLVGIPTNSSVSSANVNLNGFRTGANGSHPNNTKVDANNGQGSYIQSGNGHGNGNGHTNNKNGSTAVTHHSEKPPLSAAKLQVSLTTTAATNTATATATSISNSTVPASMNSHVSIVPRNPFQEREGENANTGVHSFCKQGQGMNMNLPQDRSMDMSGHGPSYNNMNANASNQQTPYFDQHQQRMHQHQIQHQHSWPQPAPAPSSGQSLSNSHHQHSHWPSSPYQPIGSRTGTGEERQGSSPLSSPAPIKRHVNNNHNIANVTANENQSQTTAQTPKMQKIQTMPSPSRPHFHHQGQGQGQGHPHHHQGHQQHYQPHPRISHSHSQPPHTRPHKLQQPSPRPRQRSSSTSSDIHKYNHNPSHSNWSQHSHSHNQHHSSHHGHGHGHAAHSQPYRSAHGHGHGHSHGPHQGHHSSHSHHSSKTVPGSPHGHSTGHNRIHHVTSFSSIGGGPRPAPEVLKTLLRKKACLYEAGTSRAIALITWLVGRKLALHNGYFSRQRLQSGVHAVVAQKIDTGMITRTKVNRCMQIILNSCFHYIIPRPDGTEESGDAFRKVFAQKVVDDTHLLKSIAEPWSNLDISLANDVIEGTREDETSIAVAKSAKGKKSENEDQKGAEGGLASSSKRLVLLCFNENVRSAEDVLRCHNDFIRDAAISSNLHLSSEEWRYFFSRKDDDGSQTSAGCTTIESTLSGGAHAAIGAGAASAHNSPALRGSDGCDIPYLSFDIPTEVSDCLAFADSMTEPWAKSNDMYGTMSNHELSKFRTTWCCKRYDHDESLCRFAHVNTNKGWLRRDPTKFEYCPETCPLVAVVKSKGNVLHGAHLNACKDGLLCKFAHSKEEVDYHPKRYKSRLCERAKGPTRCCDLLDICPNSHPNLPSHLSRSVRHGGKRHESSNPRSKGGHLGNLTSPRREDKADDQASVAAPVLFLSPAPSSDFEQSLQFPGLRDLYRRNCTMHYADHLKLKGAKYALFDETCGLEGPLFKPNQTDGEGFSLFH